METTKKEKKDRTITGKLTMLLAMIFLIAVAITLFWAFQMVSQISRSEMIEHCRLAAQLYEDSIANEMAKEKDQTFEAFAKKADECGDYICDLYRMDSVSLFIPDPYAGTVTYVAVSEIPGETNQNLSGIIPGRAVNRVLSPEEMKVWRREELFIITENDATIETEMLLTDGCGNWGITVVSASLNDMMNQIVHEFFQLSLVILAVSVLFILTIFFLLRKYVTIPTQPLFKAMVDDSIINTPKDEQPGE